MEKIKKEHLKLEKEYQRIYDFYEEERKLKALYPCLVGIDEAGRGPLAGPVVAACVFLPTGIFIEGLNDSKKISENKRTIIAEVIKEKAFFYSFGSSSVEEIETHNILGATFLAMQRAMDQIPYDIDYALVDGNLWPKTFTCQGEPVIKGDLIMPSIAAASILAKTKRDEEMIRLDEQYPEYGFKQHKGYGTKAHYEALDAYGLTPYHRPSFLKRYQTL